MVRIIERPLTKCSFAYDAFDASTTTTTAGSSPVIALTRPSARARQMSSAG